MKKNLIPLLLAIGCVAGAAGCSVQGGIVESRPADIVYTRPVAPGPDYVWIDGDWVWGGSRYSWREGHWDRPRRARVWEGGHWESSGRGWRWHRGHWR